MYVAKGILLYKGHLQSSPYYIKSELCVGEVTLYFKVPPLASNPLLTTLHSLLKNVLQTIDHFKISCFGAPFSWLKSLKISWGEIWTVWQMF
jgi:hypothetical protein